MRSLRATLCGLCVLLAVCLFAAPGSAQSWATIPADELKLTSVPGFPGASAILLFRDSFTDNVDDFENEHFRIKVLTDAGKKFADVEIPFVREALDITTLKARTVQPDGTAKEYNGKIFDKMIVKRGGVKVQAKVFALPDVQVGTIIEYKYRRRWPATELPATRWRLQHELFTRRAHFSIRPYPELSLAWVLVRLPPGSIPKEKFGRLEYDIENVASLQAEDHMPPEDEESMRIDFFYRRNEETAEKYWKNTGKKIYDIYEDFIGKRKGIQTAAARMVAADDDPEKKLQKIYAEVQKLRNLSLRREMTEKEEAREKLKDAQNVEDVLKNGYGYPRDLNLLFVALARAAGLEAWMVRLVERNEAFFHANVPDAGQFTSSLVGVTIDGKPAYLDPGYAFCPYGLIPWQKTDVGALRPLRDGAEIFQMPSADQRASFVTRQASLQLDENGLLRGTVQLTFGGQEALRVRRDAWFSDDTARRKDLEDNLKGWLSQGATVKLANVGNWESSEFTLGAKFEIEIPGFGTATGRRRFASLALFDPGYARAFRHANRIHPVYFDSAFGEQDDIALTLPAGYRMESLPQPRKIQAPFGTFERAYKLDNNVLRLQRVLTITGYFFPVEHYPVIQRFFNTMKTQDEEPVVLQAGAN